MAKIKKHRPSLSVVQIERILTLCKSQSIMTTEDYSLVATLAPFLVKIENGTSASNCQVAANASTKANDISFLTGIAHTGSDNELNNLTKEDYWEQCYNRWLINPALLSLKEIQASNEHRYLNSLMTPEEVTVFETNSPDSSLDLNNEDWL